MSRVPPMGLAVDVIKSLNGKAADWGVQLSVVTIPVPSDILVALVALVARRREAGLKACTTSGYI